MKTGIELIAEERKEQIEKHGWDLTNNIDYVNGELIKAALFAINPDQFEWPFYWQEKFRNKILAKTKIERLRIAGALIAAEMDRTLNHQSFKKEIVDLTNNKMIQTKIYYWHDGILEETDSLDHKENEGCSHLVVTFVNGVPTGSVIV